MAFSTLNEAQIAVEKLAPTLPLAPEPEIEPEPFELRSNP